MNINIIHHDPINEQAHEEFHYLMQKVHELICDAHAEAAGSDKYAAELQKFEMELNEATTTPNICDKLTNVRRVLATRHITDL